MDCAQAEGIKAMKEENAQLKTLCASLQEANQVSPPPRRQPASSQPASQPAARLERLAL